MILCMENSDEINITEKFVSNSINAIKTAKSKLEKYLFSNKSHLMNLLIKLEFSIRSKP
jgi:hypothetical protein